MSHRRSSLECWLAAALLGTGLVLSGSAQTRAPQPGRALQFSEPKSPNFTNSIGGRMAPSQKDDLDQLEDALFKPEDSVGPKGSMDVVIPPMRRTLPKKLVRELIERRRDAMLGSPETLANKLSPEKDSQTSDETGQEPTPLEEYYQKLAREQNTEAVEDKVPGTKDDNREADFNLPPSLKERTSRLRALLGLEPSPGKETEDDNGLDMFKSKSAFTFSSFDPPQPPSRDVIEARKARMDEFRQMTGVPTTELSPVEMFKQLGTSSDPLRPSVTPSSAPAIAGKMPSAFQNNPAPQFGSVPSLAAIPEPNRALTAPGFAPSTPQPESPPIKLVAPTPNFTAPKRPF